MIYSHDSTFIPVFDLRKINILYNIVLNLKQLICGGHYDKHNIDGLPSLAPNIRLHFLKFQDEFWQ